MRLLTIISGGMLIMTSLFCFANTGETFLALAFVLGMAMILTGLVQCFAYWRGRDNRHDNNGWIFAEALMTLILGVLVLTSLIAADAAIPMVFGLWVMFSGILRVVVATMIDYKTKRGNFVWTMLTGLLCVGAGLYAFINPLTANLSIAVLLGMLFMFQGVCSLELGIHMPHEKKEKVKKPKAKAIKIQIKKPVKKKADKKTMLFAPIPEVNLNPDNLGEDDIKKYMTEEIKLDDIISALEFNFGVSEDAAEPATEDTEMVNDIETETETESEVTETEEISPNEEISVTEDEEVNEETTVIEEVVAETETEEK